MPGAVTTYRARTGRTRRLTLAANWSMEGDYRDPGHPIFVGWHGKAGFAIQWAGMTLWAGASVLGICDGDTTGGAGTGALHGFNGLTNLIYALQFRDMDEVFRQPNSPTVDGSAFPCSAYKAVGTYSGSAINPTVSGSLTMYVDVEEWVEWIVDTRTPRGTGTDGFDNKVYPKIGTEPNPGLIDGIGLTKCYYYEAPRLGGKHGCTITVTGGVSFDSGDLAIPAGNTGAPNARMHRPVLFSGGGSDQWSVNLTCDVTSVTLGGLAVNYEAVGTTSIPGVADMVADASGNVAITLKPNVGGISPRLQAECEPDRTYALDGLITRMFETNYGASVTLRQKGLNTSATLGSYSNGVVSGNQISQYMQCEWAACVGGTPTTYALGGINRNDEEVMIWIQNAWLSGAGEDTYNWRVQVADFWPFSPLSMVHRVKTAIDAFTSAAGWAFTGGGGSISILTNGELTITTSGAAGPAVRKTYNTISSEYRRVRFRSKASAPTTITLRLYYDATSYWSWAFTIDAADTYQTFTVDLCAPGNSVALSDLTDSGWREDVGGGFGDFYGMRQIYRVEFANLGTSKTYTIREFEFYRAKAATRTAWRPLNESVLGTDTNRYYRGSVGLVDKKQALDMPYRARTGDADAFDTFYTWQDVRSVLAATGAYDLAVIPPPTGIDLDQFLYANGHVSYATREWYWLADAWYPSGSRANLLDQPIDSNNPPIFLMCADWFYAYPGCGDPKAATHGNTPLRFTKRLQLGVQGLVIDVPNGGLAGESVLLKLGAATQQTLTTDTEGFYRSAPFKRLAGTWTIGTATSGDITLTGTTTPGDRIDPTPRLDAMTDRKYRWAGLAGAAVVSGYTAVCEEPLARCYVAYLEGDDIRCLRGSKEAGFSDNLVAQDRSPGNFGIASFPTGAVYVVVSHGGAIQLYTTTDYARTWGLTVSIWSSGHDYPNIAADRDLAMLYALAHDGTGIDLKRSFDGGTTWQNEVTPVASCPAQQAGITMFSVATHQIIITYKTSGGAIDMVRSTDHGLTWGP